MTVQPAYKRVLLKVSGEALMGRRDYGLDTEVVARIAADVGAVAAMGVQVCLVIGGGNIFRGMAAAAGGMDRAQADHIGMIATVMNALALEHPTLEPAAGFAAANAALELLRAAVEPTVPTGRAAAREAMRAEIRRYARTHLQDPELGPASIARGMAAAR